MTLKYMFSNPDHMIDLAKEVQSRVYWGGYFSIEDGDDSSESLHWRHLWDAIVNEKEHKRAIGVEITGDIVKFIY